MQSGRHGNTHGSFATCLTCKARWVGAGWKLDGSCSKSSLPLPSSSATVDGSIPSPPGCQPEHLSLQGSQAKKSLQTSGYQPVMQSGVIRSRPPSRMTSSAAGHGLQLEEMQEHLQLVPGRRKRLIGATKKIIQCMTAEVNALQAPPPERDKRNFADLLELNAGAAKATLFSKQYGLNAIEPFDKNEGKDLTEPA